jgi:hypothetical protein
LEKWISPTMPETAKFGKKIQGILGVKPCAFVLYSLVTWAIMKVRIF